MIYRCVATKVLSRWIWVAKTEASMPAEYSCTQRVDSVLTHTFLHKNPKTFLLKIERSWPNGAAGPGCWSLECCHVAVNKTTVCHERNGARKRAKMSLFFYDSFIV